MTRKHYNAIAKALKDYQVAMNSMFTEAEAEPITNTVQDIVLILADIFKADNGEIWELSFQRQFSHSKFHYATKVKG